jgi:hypothetical protein
MYKTRPDISGWVQYLQRHLVTRFLVHNDALALSSIILDWPYPCTHKPQSPELDDKKSNKSIC